MDQYRELSENLRRIMGRGSVAVGTGIVRSVHGLLCDVQVGSLTVPDVRLRASETADDGELLLVPGVGSAVVFGSLTGDLSQLVVLRADRIDSLRLTGSVCLNGGARGGLVDIGLLTDRLNALVSAFNAHTHTGNMGSPTSPPLAAAGSFSRSDYEDKQVTH